MTHKRLSSEELWQRGDEWYDNRIRPIVETEENIGKLINIDVETGAYEIGTDRDALELSNRLLNKNPDAQIIQLRIGYRAVHSFGGFRPVPSKFL